MQRRWTIDQQCWIAALFFALVLVWSQAAAQAQLVLKGGTVIDGSGQPAIVADVVVRGDRIVAIGSVVADDQDQVIHVSGKVVAPGFVDLHNHSQRGVLEEPQLASQVSQGITTLIIGPDGSSPFPVGRYLNQIETLGAAANVGVMVGHGTLRRLVLGEDFRRAADESEIEAMAALVDVAMVQGAHGLSSGLEYDPGFYSQTEELVVLARRAALRGGIYMTHIRDEEDGFREALKEAISIGRKARVSVQISHLKLANTRVWGLANEALLLLDDARSQGVDVLADWYPYQAWASGLAILVPSRRFDSRSDIAEGFAKVGGASKILITRFRHKPEWEFKTVAEIAEQEKTTPVDLFILMMQQGGAGVVGESMSPVDVEAFFSSPLVIVASDGGVDSRHPRKAGTFPRVLGRFVREKGLLGLEEAIRKMTSLPAGRLRLGGRGRLAVGNFADLVVFDPEKVMDRATFQQPDQLSIGIDYVFVNGVAVWKGQAVTGQLPGRVLRRNAPE